MKILLLGYQQTPLLDFLLSEGNVVTHLSEKLSPDFFETRDFDFIISYGYRFKIRSEIIDALRGRIFNLHISYLPYNRGADPLLWSIIENTPCGVSVHLMDEGIDTGPLLIQRGFIFHDHETYEQAYQYLRRQVEKAFETIWKDLKEGKNWATPQIGSGSFHLKSDREKLPFQFNRSLTIAQIKARARNERVVNWQGAHPKNG